MDNSIVWVEKYRPTSLDTILLPERLKEKFKDGAYGNYLFTGTQGTGKTTLAKILARGTDVLQINASIDNGVDIVRNKIINFCQQSSFKSRYRSVILDESDQLSSAAQTGLRGTIEMFNKTTRFFFTANYAEKILDPIKSRLEIVPFNFTEEEEKEQYMLHLKRIGEICKLEKVKITREAAEFLLKKYYPDLRSVINILQSLSKNGVEITLDLISKQSISTGDKELYEFLFKETYPPNIYSYIKSNYINRERDCYLNLSSSFIDYMIENNHGDKVGNAAVVISKYQQESDYSVDKLISLLACCSELSRLFK